MNKEEWIKNEHKRVMSHNIYLSRLSLPCFQNLQNFIMAYSSIRKSLQNKKCGIVTCYISMFIHQFLALI